jgi:hypothetical protein
MYGQNSKYEGRVFGCLAKCLLGLVKCQVDMQTGATESYRISCFILNNILGAVK